MLSTVGSYRHDDGQTRWDRPEATAADIPDTPASPSATEARSAQSRLSAKLEHTAADEARQASSPGTGESSNNFDDDDELPMEDDFDDDDAEDDPEWVHQTLEAVYAGVKQPNGTVRTVL